MKWPLVIASTSVVMLASCAPTPDVTATDADNGGHVEIRVGDVLDVLLADDYEKSKTQWSKEGTFDWDVLKPLGWRYEPERVPPHGGDPGTYTERLQGESPGTVHLAMVQSDNSGRVSRRFAIDVTVRP
jgi:hypothetical protein